MDKPSLTDEAGEVRELTEEDLADMQPVGTALPEELAKRLLDQEQYVKTTIPLSTEVIRHFSATDPDWPLRIDDVLREYIREHHQ